MGGYGYSTKNELDAIITAVGVVTVTINTSISDFDAAVLDDLTSFYMSILDSNSDLPTSAEIDVSTAVYRIYASNAGAAFAQIGADATPSKENGGVYFDYIFATADFVLEDIVKIELSGVSVTIDGNTISIPKQIWLGRITDEASIKATVDTINSSLSVPAIDETANILLQDVIGNKDDDPVGEPNATASLIAYAKAMLGSGLVDGAKNIGFNRDLPFLTEFFGDETIEIAVWDKTETNTGDIAIYTESGYIFARLSTGITDVSTAALNTDQRFEFRPGAFNILNGVITRTVLECDMRLSNVANILNTSFLVGFGNSKASIRTSNDIAGFCLVGDVLYAVTDNGGSETLTDVSSGITVTNWNTYRITAIPGDIVNFYINNNLVATHDVAANTPDDVMYIVIHNANDAAADADVDIAHIRQWYSE